MVARFPEESARCSSLSRGLLAQGEEAPPGSTLLGVAAVGVLLVSLGSVRRVVLSGVPWLVGRPVGAGVVLAGLVTTLVGCSATTDDGAGTGGEGGGGMKVAQYKCIIYNITTTTIIIIMIRITATT